VLKKITVERKTEGAERLRTRGSQEHFRDRLQGVTFKDGRMWKTTSVDWDRGVKRYIVSYEPVRITTSTSEQDKKGYETQLIEVLDLIGPKKRDELGLAENYKYWDKLRANDLSGSGLRGAALQQYIQLKGGGPVREPITPPSFEPFRTLPWLLPEEVTAGEEPIEPEVEELEVEELEVEEPKVEEPEVEEPDWLTLSVAVPPSTRRSGMQQWLNAGCGRRQEQYLRLCQ